MKYRLPIVLVWLVMLAWLVRYEAFPEKFALVTPGYRGILGRDTLVLDAWMRILFKEQPIGYSHTRVDVNEESPTEHFIIENRIHLRLQLMGRLQDVHVETDAFLDAAQHLQRFVFSLSSRDYSARISGKRVRGLEFDVETKTGAATSHVMVEIPDDAVIYSPMTEMAMRNLKPGEKLRIRVLDPASMSSASMLVSADRRETLALGGRQIPTTLLLMDYQGMRIQSWVDDDGNIVRQLTPLGWSMEQCTSDEAFAAVRGPGATSDLLSEMAVRVKGNIRNPREARVLNLRLRGVRFADGELDTDRQQSERLGESDFALTVRADEFRAGTNTLADAAPYLASTTWVQADHPEMRKRAAQITAGLDSDLRKAEAVFQWVFREVRKEMKVSLPSAMDVLRKMAGDCNEHTYLFVGLARAAGIPSRIHVGLAYQDGKFFYHAWPAVYVGRWMEMDPTWGELAVDPTHITLVEGELASQLQLARIIGQLSIEVRDRRPAAAHPDGGNAP